MQKTLLSGNVTKDAVVNPSGEREAVSFTVATNKSYKDKNDQWVDKATFHNCVRYVSKGNGAKLAELLMKGRAVELEGQIRTSAPRPGKTRDGDEKTYVNKSIVVDEITFGAKPGQKPAAPAAE